MDYYLCPTILYDIYSYMQWSDLRQYKDVPDYIWGKLCEYFCQDPEFKISFNCYGGKSRIKRRIVLLHYLNVALHFYPPDVPAILNADRDFILLHLKHNIFENTKVDPKWYNDPEIILNAIKQYRPGILWYVNNRLKSDKQFMLCAVKYCGKCLKYAHPQLRNDIDMVKEAVSENGCVLKYASAELQANRDIIQLAIQNNGKAIKYASPDLRNDRNLILQAVKYHLEAFIFVNDIFHNDAEILIEAFRNEKLKFPHPDNAEPFKYASPRLKADRNVVLNVIKYCGEILQYTNFTYDREIVLTAITENGMALQYVSSRLQHDVEVVTTAVKQDGLSLRYASDELKANYVIVLLAVQQNGNALEYAAPILKSNKKISQIAIRQTGNAYIYTSLCSDPDLVLLSIRPHLKVLYGTPDYNYLFTQKFIQWGYVDFTPHPYYFTIERADDNLVSHLSTQVHNKELLMKIFAQHGHALNYVDDSLKCDKDLVLTAITNNDHCLRYADWTMRSDLDIALQAIKNMNSDIALLSDDLLDNKHVMTEALKYNYVGTCYPLYYAGKKLQLDDEFVMAAIKSNMRKFQHPISIF